ncbi:hypothetical protein GO684_01150 [Wolbachia endosymbiont of Litomosoides brasiliensis]|nr:hypothetical protein [Wolbachia endosymbiont of Litomosoides brasiliensis]NUY39329.1 hypothetical protein [Wolbachia endosymbiont of Litomosoides brasiliensis]
MRVGIQEEFSLNVSKSTVHRNMQKMEFLYITPRPIAMNKMEVARRV